MIGTPQRRKTDPRGRRAGLEAGFTLLEVAIAMAVLVGGLLGLSMAMISAWRIQRAANEKKLASTFATAQMERMRMIGKTGIGYAPPLGYQIPISGWTGTTALGAHKNLDGDSDDDIWMLSFYSDPATPPFKNPDTGEICELYDPMLLGLTPQTLGGRVAEVVIRDPDGSTGCTEGSGYWVTVRVFWRGTMGPAELRLGSFIAQ